jgi:prophage regulatory protein
MTYHSEERYLKVGDLSALLGVARSTIYRWVNEGHFPKPVILGPEDKASNSSTRWLRTEVQEWLDSRPREKFDE